MATEQRVKPAFAGSAKQDPHRPGAAAPAKGQSVEALMFMLDCVVIVVMVYMGLRDDRRSARTPATSIFRMRDRADEPRVAGATVPAGKATMPFQPLP